MPNRTFRRAGAALTGVALATIALAGCSDKAREPYRDAPRTSQSNNAPAEVITMPDGFSNVAFKCNGTDGVYSAFHGDDKYAAVSVVPNDKSCAGAK